MSALVNSKYPSWNSNIQQPCLCIVTTVITEFYENEQEIKTFHSEFETNVIVIRLTEDQENHFIYLNKLKKKSDSKESKIVK